MTGRYEEPETRRNLGPADPRSFDGAESTAHGNGHSGDLPNPADPGYIDPKTTPGRRHVVSDEHPMPSYVDPSGPAAETPQPHYPGGVQQQGQVPYVEPSPSGPQQGFSTASAYADPSTQFQPGPYQPGAQSGPHQVGQSGAQPAPGQPASGHSAPGQPAPGQSGPYAVGAAPSAPQQPQAAQPGQSGPHEIPGVPAPYPGVGQPAQQPPEQPFGQDLSSAQLLRQTKRPPQSGWRKALYLLSGKSINLGESQSDMYRRELISRINQPLAGCYKIAMLSLKGGVGKTTATATLGSTFSSLRGDRVVAVDANPDRGTLSQKIPLETTATVRHLLRDAQRISKYSDVRSYTSQGPSRLEVLASEQDPAVSEAFSEDDYRRTVTLLEHFYNVVLTDCGTGLMHSAMKGVLDVADSLVLVSSSSIDGARSASGTLDWLDAHGYGELVKRSVTVINSVRPGSGKVDIDKLAAHFGSRCRAVAKIPFDPHLEEGAEVELDQLAAPTRLALLELAALVADDFPQAAGRQRMV
ncbi:AAA family ATPase [Allosaccharopolyspora coralli]|uniref:AAA family ATPase n=1 Tax=Allosaccharopolyspora coralli TaxID=2665642 RepID=A0A5Q3QE48_9PSEU|nr:MinD/ParA family protein [Allosaccharopolyspora coralli]QGK71646.1 AAA family ATPase [Allosaccharopolyspora coralli]